MVRGHGVGRTLGFPTANFDTFPADLPDGIYAGWVSDLADPANRSAAAFYLGKRPTFAGTTRSFEAYLLDGAPVLDGHELRIELVSLIRDDRAFPTPKALAHQMTKDIAVVRQRLAD